MPEAYGIDFGTTNSAAAGWLGHGRFALYGADAQTPLPSAVAIDRTTGTVTAVGAEVWNRREQLAGCCEVITSVKSHLAANKSWLIGPREWKAEQVAAEIFRGLKKQVAAVVGPDAPGLSAAVCTVPVGFAPDKRRALREAARLAGVEILALVSEPTAALCKNFGDVRQWPRVAVFDWGGGTLDICVVEIRGQQLTEIAHYGRRLGGDDLDRKLAEHLHARAIRVKEVDLAFTAVDPRSRDLLVGRAEQAKRRLAAEDRVEVRLANYGPVGALDLEVDAETLYELFRPEMEDAFEALAHTVQTLARTSFKEIGAVLMVGGSSKLRGLQDYFLERGLSCVVLNPPDADWNIAQGAALLAASPGQTVVGQDFGLSASDGSFYPLLHDGHPLKPEDPGVIHRFGLVEDATEARFIFAQSRRSGGGSAVDEHGGTGLGLEPLGTPLLVPAYGFSNEPILLQVRVDEDGLARVEGRSERRGAGNARHWEYAGLKYRYRMPDTLP